jgi:Tfp pilus assembly protein PilV
MAASVVVSVSVLGIVSVLTAASQQTSVMRQNAIAATLARQLLEEMAAKPFGAPASSTATTRGSFQTIGDYNHYTDQSTLITQLDGSTVAVGDGETYTRLVSEQTGAKPWGDTASPASDFVLVTVTVTTPAGQQVQVSRTFTNVPMAR